MTRPEIDVGDDVVERVEQFAEKNGLRQSRAWGELVRAGLRNLTDWDDPYVRSYQLRNVDRSERELVNSMSKEDRIRLNEDRLETYESVEQTDVNTTPVHCVACGIKKPRESMYRRDERGDLLCEEHWQEQTA